MATSVLTTKWQISLKQSVTYIKNVLEFNMKMELNEALEKLENAGLIAEKVQRLDEWGQSLAKIGLCLAMVLGIRACNGKWTESALEKIDTKQGNALQLFNEYNQAEFGGVLSQETSMARAVFGAVVQYAQKHNCSIADAAKRIKKEFIGEMRASISPDGVAARITSVLSTHDDDYGDIVMVSFRYKVGTDEHASYKSSEVIIPANAASNYNKHVPVQHYKEAPAETPAEAPVEPAAEEAPVETTNESAAE